MERKIESFEIVESHCADEVKIEFDPSKYEMVERKSGYYVVNKQSQYPKTYEECCEVLGISPSFGLLHDDNRVILAYRIRELAYLQELLICRDAYWKIAGDWKPDWRNNNQEKYGIYNALNNITFELYGGGDTNMILTFPTEEMRDAFYENFKELIEKCKELL